jgi:hypothetical protein
MSTKLNELLEPFPDLGAPQATRAVALKNVEGSR